jgi:hypothetical protein
MKNKTKGIVVSEVLLLVAIVGALGFFAFPKLFDGQSRRADSSVEATAELEAANKAQGAFVAASITSIQKANSDAPESPSKDFIGLESGLALSGLPSPDYKALLESEKRRVAVMEGRIEEISGLYEKAGKRLSELQKERDEAVLHRQAIDQKLVEAAAVSRGKDQVIAAVGLLALLLLCVTVYMKLFGINSATLGLMAADIRSGTPPIIAMDTHLAPWMLNKVQRHAKLNINLPDPK